jgi:hypothetical protein
VSNLRGRDDQEGRKARKEQEEEACDAESNMESTERRKEAEPEVAEPSCEKANICQSRSEEADDSESESRLERAEERRYDSETPNQPIPKRTRKMQRMHQHRDSKQAEKGKC